MERGYLFALRESETGAPCPVRHRRGLARGHSGGLVREMRQGSVRIWEGAMPNVRKVGAG